MSTTPNDPTPEVLPLNAETVADLTPAPDAAADPRGGAYGAVARTEATCAKIDPAVVAGRTGACLTPAIGG